MAKRNLSRELLGEVHPSNVREAAIGAALSFFVFIGTVVTFEPTVASYMGSDSFVLAQVRGGTGGGAGGQDDADLPAAQDAATRGQQQIESQRAFDQMQRDMTRQDNAKYQNPGYKPTRGDTWFQDGAVYRYTGSTWKCIANCKSTGQQPRTR